MSDGHTYTTTEMAIWHRCDEHKCAAVRNFGIAGTWRLETAEFCDLGGSFRDDVVLGDFVGLDSSGMSCTITDPRLVGLSADGIRAVIADVTRTLDRDPDGNINELVDASYATFLSDEVRETVAERPRSATAEMASLGRRLLRGGDPATLTAGAVVDETLGDQTDGLHWYPARDVEADANGHYWTLQRYIDDGDPCGDVVTFDDVGFTTAEVARIHDILATVAPEANH